jgi:hypothetical protein
MNSYRRIAAMFAIALMLAPVGFETSASGLAAAIELAGNKPTYPPCAFAAKGRACLSGHGLVSGGGRGHPRR